MRTTPRLRSLLLTSLTTGALLLPACASETSSPPVPGSSDTPSTATLPTSRRIALAPTPPHAARTSAIRGWNPAAPRPPVHKDRRPTHGFNPPVNPTSFVASGGDTVGIYTPAGDATSSDTCSYNGGSVLGTANIEVIFWGASWETASGPSAGDVNQMIQRLISTTYLDQLRQYGFQNATFAGSVFVTSPAPPAQFTEDDPANIVSDVVNAGWFPEPDEAGGNLLYVVVMPSSSTINDGFLAAHSASETGSIIDTDYAAYMWIRQGTIDQMSEAFSHELAEAISDSATSGTGWLMEKVFNNDGSEIGDACDNSVDVIDNILVQAYFSQQLHGCAIPFQPAPTITAVNPAVGPEAGGQSVTITGTGFDTFGSTQFTFGSSLATNVQCTSSTTCTATTPPGPSSIIEVKAAVNDFTFNGSSASTYRYGPPVPYCSASFQCFSYSGATEVSCPYGLTGLTLLRSNGSSYAPVPNPNTTQAIDAFIDYYAPAAGTEISYEVEATDSTGTSFTAPLNVTAVDCSCHPESYCGDSQCGTSTDGCGGTLKCGTNNGNCGSGLVCSNNMCCPVGETYSTITNTCAKKPVVCPRGEGDCGGYCCRCGPNNPC